MFRKLSALFFGILFVFATVSTTQAQFGIGGSYEIRNQDPETGFGLRVEKGISLPIPLLKLGVRASVSHFSKQNQLTLSRQNQDINYDREIRAIDYGASILGKVQLGFVKPYIGVGIGGTRKSFEINVDESVTAIQSEEQDKNNFTYHGLIGGEFSLIPLINPFVEYRINDYSGSMNMEDNQNQLEESIEESNGRLIFGVMLRF
jgi:opacity protein-like surface antigen